MGRKRRSLISSSKFTPVPSPQRSQNRPNLTPAGSWAIMEIAEEDAPTVEGRMPTDVLRARYGDDPEPEDHSVAAEEVEALHAEGLAEGLVDDDEADRATEEGVPPRPVWPTIPPMTPEPPDSRTPPPLKPLPDAVQRQLSEPRTPRPKPPLPDLLEPDVTPAIYWMVAIGVGSLLSAVILLLLAISRALLN